ncbi:MAG: EVE domain-containing protein [Gammaproteobacteria bacterium]|nr:EVE domain-containing protein [Gammaproteobacteria bacterium]
MAYWLFKSEPASFSIDDLAARPGQTEHWDGVRNFQARNYMRAMAPGDLAFFYHSSCAVPGVVGEVEIGRAAYPDFTAWDPQNPHYDPRASASRPIWSMVDVVLRARYPRIVTLTELKACPALAGMRLLARGNRLSVLPVSAEEWSVICGLAGR